MQPNTVKRVYEILHWSGTHVEHSKLWMCEYITGKH